MNTVIGRHAEIAVLKEALNSRNPELIALYGRRRVGKTYLIRAVYEPYIAVEFSAIRKASLSVQLENFSDTLAAVQGDNVAIETPKSWIKAFRLLQQYLDSLPERPEKRVVFFDEFPWFDTVKSGFLPAFEHFWNIWASRKDNIVIVICGSAASWMIQNVVRNKGGLHNRLTRRIRLMPFNLYETEQFLKANNVLLDRYSIAQLYMAIGGIPQYLNGVRPGDSVAQTIDRLFFYTDGWLYDEYRQLYAALFENPERHLCIIQALSEKPQGMSRTELLSACAFTSGGSATKVIEELIESGFVAAMTPFGKSSKDVLFKLCDPYTHFYLKFVKNSKAKGDGAWMTQYAGAAWASWSGLAFENLCFRHLAQIKKALGIAGVYTEVSSWRYFPKNDGETGVQVDLVLDRKDNTINLVEMKFYNDVWTLDKNDASVLRTRTRVFMEQTGTRKSVFTTLISTFGAKTNEHYLGCVQSQLALEALFQD